MTMQKAEQKAEKQRVYDLLDALTKSGVLAVDGASLHVVLMATHQFDKSVLNTLVQDNVNPIEKVERSNLIIASTIHKAAPATMIKDAELQRIQKSSPMLFPAIEGGNSNN